MNIFILDEDPHVAAQMLCDKHVPKMIIESAQMLSTVHRMLDGTPEKRRSKSVKQCKRIIPLAIYVMTYIILQYISITLVPRGPLQVLQTTTGTMHTLLKWPENLNIVEIKIT